MYSTSPRPNGTGPSPWGVYYEGEDYVTFNNQPMPLVDWQRLYPNGKLVRVRYVEAEDAEYITMGADTKVLVGASMRNL